MTLHPHQHLETVLSIRSRFQQWLAGIKQYKRAVQQTWIVTNFFSRKIWKKCNNNLKNSISATWRYDISMWFITWCFLNVIENFLNVIKMKGLLSTLYQVENTWGRSVLCLTNRLFTVKLHIFFSKKSEIFKDVCKNIFKNSSKISAMLFFLSVNVRFVCQTSWLWNS